MRTATVVLLFAWALAPNLNAADPDDDVAVRDPQNILFEGVESFDARQIRKRLSLDIDIQVAAHPSTSLSYYLKQLEDVLVSGYRASGFPKPQAEARFDAQRGRVIVRVQEGRRYRCGRVRVTGLDREDRVALAAHLTQEVPPANSVPIVVARDDGTSQTAWETSDGSPATLVKPLWKAGEPASFDEQITDKLENRAKQWFWERGRVLEKLHAEMKCNDATGEATLVIVVDDPGVQPLIGEISIRGAKINSPDEVQQLLAIETGMPMDGRIEAQLRRRLWECGRFIGPEIKKRPPQRTPQGARIDLEVFVTENAKAPLLTTLLAPHEQALLKLRDWVVQWTEGLHEDDVVFDAQMVVPVEKEGKSWWKLGAAPAEKTYELHVVASPGKGQVISFRIRDRKKIVFAQTFIARDQHVIFHSPLTGTHLDIEHSSTTQLTSLITMQAFKPESDKQLGNRMNIGFMRKSLSSGAATPLNLQAEIDPLSVLLECRQLAESDCRCEAGIVTIGRKGAELQIEERTGRPVKLEIDMPGVCQIRCRIKRGALQQEFERQDRLLARSSNVYDPRQSHSSLAVYGIGEYRRLFHDELSVPERESLQALQKLCRLWPIESVGTLLDQFDDIDWSPEAFHLNRKQVQWIHPALSTFFENGAGSGTLAGYLLPVYRELVPRTGWLWPMGQNALFAVIGEPVTSDYRQIIASGPLGHLAGALLLAPFSPELSQILAAHAEYRLSNQALLEDCQPFLVGDSWLGRNILSLAEALRQLDDAEIRALVRLLPDKRDHRQVAEAVLLLKSDPKKPVGKLLPLVAERLWRGPLGPTVESALKTLSAGKSLEPSGAIKNVEFNRAAETD